MNARVLVAVTAALWAAAAFAAESFEIDGQTGSVYYEYGFEVPQARGRYQPTAMLRYGGQQGDFGSTAATFGLPPAPYVSYDLKDNGPLPTDYVYRYVDQRSPRRLLLPSPRFTVSGAPTTPIVPSNPSVEDTGPLDLWSLDGATICARDGQGNLYRFETTFPAAEARFYLLTQVVDLDGNVTKYEYESIRNLRSIKYNAYGAQPSQPSACTIVPAETFATEIEFEYGGNLQNVRVKTATAGGAQVVIRRYSLGYTQIAWDWQLNKWPWVLHLTKDVLQSITEIGGESGLARRPPTTFEYVQEGNDPDPSVKGAHLRAVTNPQGARREFTWQDSTAYGDTLEESYPMVRQVKTTGPGLVARVADYGYKRGSPRESWTIDATTGIVRHSWWYASGKVSRAETGVQLTAGSYSGTWTPPTYSAFQTEVTDYVARALTAPGATGSCTTVAPSSAPATLFVTKAQRTRHVGTLQLTGEQTVACADVDAWGNVTKASVDADTSVSGDEYVERTSFEAGFNANAFCKTCVRERTRTDPSKLSPDDQLEATYFKYGPSFLKTEEYRQVTRTLNPAGYLGTAKYPLTAWMLYNADGTLAARRDGAVVTLYTYDTFRLRRATESVADTNGTLVTTTEYDDFGRPRLVSGPVVSGRNDPAATKYFTYDDLGRTRIVSQRERSDAQVLGAIQAFEYAEYSGSTPASTSTYDFAVPTDYPDPSIPSTSDVRVTVSWTDALGRTIQVRERMGGSASGNAGAGITQNLTQVRVASAIVYDAAGRESARLDPYYSASLAYADVRTALDALPGQALRANLTSYDAEGREICKIVRAMSTTIPAAGACTSSFAESSNYARASLLSYRGVVDSGNRLAVKTVPPENNYSGGPMTGSESFYDPGGNIRKTVDAEGNLTRTFYDALGRQTKTSRSMNPSTGGTLTPSTRPTTVDTTLTLDLMGRTVQRTDLNMGRRTFVFDDAISATLPVTMRFDKTGEEVRFTYDKGRPKTTTLCTKVGAALTCVVDSTLVYDVPYGAGYGYTAGRVSYAYNQNGTVAQGYDMAGAVTRRDQWLPGITGGFGTVESPRLDGLTVATGLTTPHGNFSYATSYDSAARMVGLSNGGTAYWNATGSFVAGAGAYDAIGQLGAASLDAARVNESWSYGSSSGLLAAHSARFGTAGAVVHSMNGLTYRGIKLAGYTDVTTSPNNTTYAYWYSETGRLIAAKATPSGTSPITQNSLVCVTYNGTKKYGPGPSLGNIERTREGVSVPASFDYAYTGTDVESSMSPPGPDAPSSVGSSALGYDAYGRIISAAGGAETFTYDLLGRITSISKTSGASETLYYDALGALVQRKVGTTVISYVGRRATITGSLASGCATASCGVVVGSVDAHVTVGPGRRIASVRISPTESARTLYYYRDRLGSVVATTLGGGLSGASYRYSAHGKLEVAAGESSDSASELGYTGALRISNGYYAVGARAYAPALKMWLQPDPLQPFKYDYADGDPVNKIDPTGLFATGVDPALVAMALSTSSAIGLKAISTVPVIGNVGLSMVTWPGGAALVGAIGVSFGAGWLAGTWINERVSDTIQAGLDKVLGAPGERAATQAQAAKRDLRQVNALVKQMGGNEEQRDEFGKFLEDLKRSGERGSANSRGDFTWEELEERWAEFIQTYSNPQSSERDPELP